MTITRSPSVRDDSSIPRSVSCTRLVAVSAATAGGDPRSLAHCGTAFHRAAGDVPGQGRRIPTAVADATFPEHQHHMSHRPHQRPLPSPVTPDHTRVPCPHTGVSRSHKSPCPSSSPVSSPALPIPAPNSVRPQFLPALTDRCPDRPLRPSPDRPCRGWPRVAETLTDAARGPTEADLR